MFYVFEHYLSLYTTIFKNFISYYFFENFIKQNLKDINDSELIENISLNFENCGNNSNIHNEREKEFHVIEKDFYEEHSASKTKGAGNNGIFYNSNIMTILSKIPYLKRLNAFSTIGNKEGGYSNKNKDEQKEYFKNLKNIPFSHTNQLLTNGNYTMDKKYDKILHINESEYVPRYANIFSRSY
jgi:hypothetical protein